MGYNWRLSEPHAAIGLVHLSHLADFVAERNSIAARYDAALADGRTLRVVPVPKGSKSNFYKYLAWLPDGVDRAVLKKRLREEHGVGLSGEVYEAPLHLQPVFEGIAPSGSLKVSEEVCARHVCLPVYQGMGQAEVDAVVNGLRAVIGQT
jgi:dTDP-4-amino-4,6-dideoxygalactose transaminase